MRRTDSGMQNLKLVLMGIIAVAIPILFILQHNESKKEKKEAADYKSQIVEMKAELAYKNKLLDLIAYKVIVPDTIKIFDTVKIGKVFLNQSRDRLLVITGFTKKSIDSDDISSVSYYLLPLNPAMTKLINEYKHRYSDSMGRAGIISEQKSFNIHLIPTDQLYKLLN